MAINTNKFVTRWLREPLVHFLLAGGILFAVYSVLNPELAQRDNQNRIEITEADLQQMDIVWRSKRQRPAAPEELVAMVDSKIKEEILYREALALGLDREDTIIKRRLAQKMEFLGEDVSGIKDPGEEELKAWFDNRAESFALPGRISFHHLYFSPDRRGDSARTDALQALETLTAQAKEGVSQEDAELADPFMYRDYYAERDPTQIAQDFGGMFTESVFQLPSGGWQGPIESGMGWHLVLIENIEPGRIPPFELVVDQVKAEWIAEQREIVKGRAFEVMRSRYEIILPVDSPSDNVSSSNADAPVKVTDTVQAGKES